jgi:hypothetical protein
VVGRLVEEEDISVLQNGSAERQFHLPSARQAGDVRMDAGGGAFVLGKAELEKLLINLGLRDLRAECAHIVDEIEVRQVALDIVLHVDCLELVRGREVLDLPIGDGAHERSLAASVVPAHTIPLAAFEMEARIVEENLGAVAQRELAVAQVLAVVVLVLLRLLGHALLVT